MKIRSCTTVVLLLLLAAAANAQERKLRFEFFGEFVKPWDKEFEITYPQSLTPIQGQHEFSPGGGGGVRFGIDGAKYWGQDYLYSYSAQASRIVSDGSRFAFTNKLHQVCTNILFYPFSLEQESVFPYITAGVGATFVSISQQTMGAGLDPTRGNIGPIKGETIFAFNAGGGIRVRANERFGVRIDIRDYMSRPIRYGLAECVTCAASDVFPVSGVFHVMSASFGLVVYF